MNDQGNLIEPPSLYERMKARGVNMGFYERGKAGKEGGIPLDDQVCSNSSIYRLLANGTLWTIRYREEVETSDDGKPIVVRHFESEHRKVRDTGKQLPSDTFICMHTKVGYPTFEEAITHNNCKEGGGQ